ncbi:ABC transporter substrate-binding protein [Pseudonocardia humida]|uniref:Sugar ABC transporter substrate-binding protein n=1 Tax=Pseudonocardia humida TaxID=2800819 RepID=A0ABT1A3V8_9PSEU|nr:sugar ABC transporter substrate-binding protein [Pseudonocardia humida]MCO1657668.1 sugar ABC transporter substrate-binding protein [Pseudonocardia humida]
MRGVRGRSVRTRAAVGVVAALLLAVSACGGGGGAAPGGGEVAEVGPDGVDDGATLTLWARDSLETQTNLLVDAYNATHQNKIEVTIVPNDDYVTKVGAAAGAGGLPDLFAADIVYVPNWAEQGLFQDLTANIDRLPFKDTLNEGHMSAGTLEGSSYVLPFVLDLSMLFWNKDLFREAGLDPEKAPATLEEFAAAAKAVQALGKPDTYGTATGLNCGGCLVFTWFPSVWAAGEQVMNPEGTESLLASSTATRVYDTWRDLWASGAVLPSSQDEAGPTWTAGFTSGQVGLMPYPATLLASAQETVDVGVAGIPGPGGGASTFVGGDGIGVSKDSTKAAQAWNFLAWLMTEDAQVEVLAKNNDVVSRSDLAANAYASADPRLVTINEVAAEGVTPVARNFQQAFNAPTGPWLTLVREAVLGPGTAVEQNNAEITAVLGQ